MPLYQVPWSMRGTIKINANTTNQAETLAEHKIHMWTDLEWDTLEIGDAEETTL